MNPDRFGQLVVGVGNLIDDEGAIEAGVFFNKSEQVALDLALYEEVSVETFTVTLDAVEMALVIFTEGIFTDDNTRGIDVPWAWVDVAVLYLIKSGKIVAKDALASIQSRRS